jgi:hypothetical protein
MATRVRFYLVSEVTEKLRLDTDDQVHALIKSGRLSAIVIDPTCIRITSTQLANFLRSVEQPWRGWRHQRERDRARERRGEPLPPDDDPHFLNPGPHDEEKPERG